MKSAEEKVPSGWEKSYLRDVIELKYGKGLPAVKRDGSGFPVFGSNGVVGYHSRSHIKGPALIVGRKGSIGEVHFSESACSPIDTAYYIDEFYKQSPRFWFYFLKHLKLGELNRSTALPGLNREEAYALRISVPPLPEQRRIVAKIEALQERSRKARAALEAIPPLLEQFRQSVLAAAFRGDLTADWRAQHPDVEPASVLLDRIRAERRRRWEEAELAKMQAKGKMPKDEKWKERYKEPEPVDETDLPELPEGWGWTTVEDVSAVVVDCPHSTPSWTEKGRICVRTTEFRPGYLDLNQVRFVSEVTYRKRIERLQPKQGDILYSREGGILGVACIIPPRVELCLGQRMMLLRIEEKLSPRFVMHLLNSPLIQEKVRALTGGSASPHLNVGDVRKLPVPLPSPLEQEHIVRNIEEQLSATSEIGADVAENLELLDQLDQSILAKAFRGELVPQDPNDEPASVLLERIRAEREAQSAKPRAKKKTLGSIKRTKKAPPVSVNENDDLPLFNSLQK